MQWDFIYLVQYRTISLHGDMDGTPRKLLASQNSEGEDIVSGKGDSKRRTSTRRKRVAERRTRSVREFCSRRGIRSDQPSMCGIEDKVLKGMWGVCQTYILCSGIRDTS